MEKIESHFPVLCPLTLVSKHKNIIQNDMTFCCCVVADHWRHLNDSFMTQTCRRRMILEWQELAGSCPSSQHKINDSYRETLASAVGRYEVVNIPLI